ncbi:hypothetical protein CcaCcLH18_06907 [Colletotrichum camelliae]|nr:hypothetical protein CcaCcLH18_06907 [Colletotrichum camelliae]
MASIQGPKVRLWYRILYRNALRAVQFSVPARYVVRDQLRAAFREENAKLDHRVCQRTNWFLQNAAQDRGLEHKILKNLTFIAYERYKKKLWKVNYLKDNDRKHKPLVKAENEFTPTFYHHFDITLAMLNKSMGLALRCGPI